MADPRDVIARANDVPLRGKTPLTQVPGPEIAYRTLPGEFAKSRLAGLMDPELVRRTLAGESLAFEILVDRYTPMVVGFLYGKTRCESDAEDIAQEVFLTAYRGLANLRDSDRVGPWLMRIVRSRLIDHYRRVSRRPQVVSDPCRDVSPEGGLLSQMAEPSPHPGQLAAAAQTRQIVLQEIAGMKEKYRDILYLRLLGEESSDAIARRLGLRESAVRMRLFRGMRLLRKSLKKHGLGPENMD